MDNTYEAATVQLDDTGFDSLQDQILNSKNTKVSEDIRDKAKAEHAEKTLNPIKKSVLKRGEQTLELEDDYEVEFMADKRPTKLTLRELKERAAGDIAVKNRMHALAEEKKRIQSTFKEFTTLSKTDPLAALEFISNKAKEADGDFEYAKYIEKLAEQAEKIGQMDEKERKAWELEKKLSKAEQDLSQRERERAVVLRKQEILSTYPEIGDSEFSQMVDAVLSDEALMEDLEDESQVMDKVEELVQEALTQRDIMSIIQEVNPSHLRNEELIFSISTQIRQNPDLNEEDVRDIIQELIGQREEPKPSVSNQKQKDIEILSRKARQGNSTKSLRSQTATPYDLLMQQLHERKQEISKTPLWKR